MIASRAMMRSAISGLLACGMAAAQTFVVDVGGGAGASFTDLPTAIAAVPDGSLLLVRPGAYANFTIVDKTLTIVADPGVTVGGIVTAVAVRNLQSFRTVRLAGFACISALGPGELRLENDVGQVVLDRVTGAGLSGAGVGLRITSCADVRVAHSTFGPLGAPALTADTSRVTIADTLFTAAPGYPALLVNGGNVELAGVRAFGGGWFPAGSALVTSAADLRVLGNSTLSTAWAGAIAGGHAILGVGGTARLDPAVVLAANGVPTIGGSTVVVVTAMPAVLAATAGIGGAATGSLRGPTGAIGVLFAGFVGKLHQVPPFVEPIGIDLATAVPMAAGPLSPPIAGSYQVPASPAVIGLAVAWQGASFATNGVELSNAATYVHW